MMNFIKHIKITVEGFGNMMLPVFDSHATPFDAIDGEYDISELKVVVALLIDRFGDVFESPSDWYATEGREGRYILHVHDWLGTPNGLRAAHVSGILRGWKAATK